MDRALVLLADELLQNGAGPLYDFFHAGCFVGGLLLMAMGIYKLPRAAAAGPMGMHNPFAGPLATMVVGILILGIGLSAETLTETLFINAPSPLGYSAVRTEVVDAGAAFNAVIWAVVQFVAFIGWIGILRGLLLMRASAEGSGQASISQAITHLIGGVCAINLGELMVLFESSMGMGNFVQTV